MVLDDLQLSLRRLVARVGSKTRKNVSMRIDNHRVLAPFLGLRFLEENQGVEEKKFLAWGRSGQRRLHYVSATVDSVSIVGSV